MRIYYLLLFSFFLLFNGKVWTTQDLITYAEENENSIAPEGKEYYTAECNSSCSTNHISVENK